MSLLAVLALEPAEVAVRCRVPEGSDPRVFELQRAGEEAEARWSLVMRGGEAGEHAVVLPLPYARPTVTDRRVSLDFRTLNGGRSVKLIVEPDGRATLDVYTNFELEVNVEADLDPRVELMNTEGPLRALSCAIAPKP